MKSFEGVVTESETETEKLGAEFAARLKKGDFVAFRGDLGAGKTAFVRGAVSLLCPDAHVSSPTYALVNEYRGSAVTVSHFDMYRIKDEDDLYSIGFFDYLDGVRIVFAEWCENILSSLPADRYDVLIEKLGENSRRITVGKADC